MANRHLSRSIVLQTLFEWDFLLNQNKDKVLDISEVRNILNKNLKEFAPDLKDDNFINNLIDLVLKKNSIIDEIIIKVAPDWPIDKISVVDRNILRIGLAELLFSDKKEVPPKVAINEAIELAKTFGGENSSKFINGVLGSVYKEIGEPDKNEQKKNSDKENISNNTELQIEELAGALIYTKKDNRFLFALVHDVFNYWTFSKGKLDSNETLEENLIRIIKKEISLDISVEEKLGENEYITVTPEKGKIIKKVVYFLAFSEYKEIVLEKSGGLDNAKWFDVNSITDLRMYNDIVPLIIKAVEIINKK